MFALGVLRVRTLQTLSHFLTSRPITVEEARDEYDKDRVLHPTCTRAEQQQQ